MNKKPGRKTIKPPPDFDISGFCKCGCGQKTTIAEQTRVKFCQYKGYPIQYIHGHNQRGKRCKSRPGFKYDVHGYCLLYMPNHRLANDHGYVLEHRFVWEQKNKCQLFPGFEIHHIDGNPSNNAPNNLIALTKRDHRGIHCEKNGFPAKKVAQHKRLENHEYRQKLSESGKKGWIKRKAKKEQENGH